ncbi:cupin domain-containing protein [Sphingomonas sp. QA11]|uniref:cupin domain-containing protein n=1 Tax=Sphingomonas sp. QA11 TaxID=2950605 RepID=UPI002349619C|nr:cupin domain-containing protein [Sphingomonas sp. QA11]WCM27402.1 cupin domain-containing protein [Sphingomonas sp. QA11]
MTFEPFDTESAPPDGRRAAKLRLFDAMTDGAWRGRVFGDTLGTSVTVLAYGNDVIGQGPTLHVHPYDEIFVVLEGHARFFVGDDIVDAEAGDVLLGPKGVPHRFENLGPGRLQTLDIHLASRWYQNSLS